MTATINLFDVRGGSLQSHVCEVCNEPIPKDSVFPVCAEHGLGEEDEE